MQASGASREVFQPLTRTLAALRLQARKLRSLEDLVSWTAKCRHAVLFTDSKGRFIAANENALQLTGFSRYELLRKSVWDLTESSTQFEFEPLWRAFLVTGTQRGVYKLRRKSGRTRRVAYMARVHVLKDIHVSVLTPTAASSSRRRRV